MNDIMRFIAKRLAIGVLVVLFVTILVFAIMQMMPGDTIDLMVDTRVSAEKVAEYAYKQSLKGKRIAVVGFGNKLTAFAPRFFPRKFVARISAGTLKKGG